MNAPFVSVVLPFWNRRDVLPAALDGLRRQTYKNWELVAIDDGSTDGGGDLFRNPSPDARARCCRLTRNAGAAAARNRGVREARGEYIAFLDSDDLWMPRKLERQIALLAGVDAPSSAVLYTKIEYRERRRVTCPPAEYWRSGHVYRDFLAGWQPAITPSVLLSRDLFLANGGFDESMTIGEDNDLWMRLAGTCAFHCVPEVLVRVCRHSANRLTSDPDAYLRGLHEVLNKWHDERVRCLGEGATRRCERHHLGQGYAYAAIEEALHANRMPALKRLYRGLWVGRIPPRQLMAVAAALALGPWYETVLHGLRGGRPSRCAGVESGGTPDIR